MSIDNYTLLVMEISKQAGFQPMWSEAELLDWLSNKCKLRGLLYTSDFDLKALVKEGRDDAQRYSR